jgi:hypothetical protein
MNLLWLILYTLLSFFQFSHQDGNLFYMYDLDEEFWWRWPEPLLDCSSNGYIGHEHAAMSGIGTPINPDNGLFLTWHFSMFSSLYNRYKCSNRRTYDPEKASIFIIPYDLGLDGYLNKYTCKNTRKCTYDLPSKLQTLLSTNAYWRRHEGADHVVLWSLGQYHPWPHNGCDLFMKDFCGKCTFTCYWMDSNRPESRFVSLPFPSAYHWWDGIKNIPWSMSNNIGSSYNLHSVNAYNASSGDYRNITQHSDLNAMYNESETTSHIPHIKPNNYRNLTAVYLGSTQTLNPAHTKVRRAMTTQCNASTECHWKQIAHTSIDNKIGDFLEIYKKAVFCLCPPGDDPARKAVFDAIISGCIPVIFEKATLYNQYPWHIGEQAALDISVNIPGALVRANKLNFMNILLNIPKDVIYKKQIALTKIAPRVQYAIPPLETLVNKSAICNGTWDPPFQDAADIALDGFIERITHILRNESTNIPPPYMLLKAWHQPYDSVIIQVPKYNQSTSITTNNEIMYHHSHLHRYNNITNATNAYSNSSLFYEHQYKNISVHKRRHNYHRHHNSSRVHDKHSRNIHTPAV